MSKAISETISQSLGDYVIRVLDSVTQLDATLWNALLAEQDSGNLFMRYEYLAAMAESGCASVATGWTVRFVTLWQSSTLAAACVFYIKNHSYGEYVFDWAWANAYQQHGLDYYPKALVASPFSPVPGARLLARNADERLLLVKALLAICKEQKLSSLHILLGNANDQIAAEAAGLMLRNTVQFHWENTGSHVSFDAFLASLSQEKRKKIRAERRKVVQAGVVFRWSRGPAIRKADWDFFYRCYERTYLEHGNAPYLSRDFFSRVAADLPDEWLLFTAEVNGEAIAASLVGLSSQEKVAYGRYWGALKRVDCLHFEACYYQPLQWCIEQGFERFEGGAQGEHKMARALMPVKTVSAHWLAHPSFADAVERFLEREGDGIAHYMDDLNQRSPFRKSNISH